MATVSAKPFIDYCPFTGELWRFTGLQLGIYSNLLNLAGNHNKENIMKKLFLSILALSIAVLGVSAQSPVKDEPAAKTEAVRAERVMMTEERIELKETREASAATMKTGCCPKECKLQKQDAATETKSADAVKN